jgi:hypothetical protein
MIATSVSLWAATKGVEVPVLLPLLADMFGLVAVGVLVGGGCV